MKRFDVNTNKKDREYEVIFWQILKNFETSIYKQDFQFINLPLYELSSRINQNIVLHRNV